MRDDVWDEPKIAKLCQLWAEGLSTAEIGRRIGMSKNAVAGKRNRLGLPERPSPIKRGAEPKAPVTSVTSAAVRQMAARAVLGVVNAPAAAKPVRLGHIQHCSWPIGEPGTKEFHFCDDPSEAGKPYCPAHCKRAYLRAVA